MNIFIKIIKKPTVISNLKYRHGFIRRKGDWEGNIFILSRHFNRVVRLLYFWDVGKNHFHSVNSWGQRYSCLIEHAGYFCCWIFSSSFWRIGIWKIGWYDWQKIYFFIYTGINGRLHLSYWTDTRISHHWNCGSFISAFIETHPRTCIGRWIWRCGNLCSRTFTYK